MASTEKSSRKTYHHGDLASELLRAAERELSENGIESFSLRAVAKRAGVSHGAPAHHFRDARGLLTALAASGFRRLVATQEARQDAAERDVRSQQIAVGLGYIDFALENPALFRLMFSSEKPDRTVADLGAASIAAYEKLMSGVRSVVGNNPPDDPGAMKHVMASWAMAHGLADLIVSGRAERPLNFSALSPQERDALLSDLMASQLDVRFAVDFPPPAP
ncbi:MAG TPA: TetR family transcriptional regulator [Hyphomonas sp.]|jgi:AcrR family transcriptional regulator|uniref:Transcriptional regulator, TetR family n=1 Tax=hydrothermal vent metagenome TaxID=652676 RepID=A0A161K1Z3_9ZZZZ|nr:MULTISPECIES: TetR/AcrR family transcriptional regulator [unclassified Hyphomonas]MAA82399.1 TetR family transcriptional regulator [Hyphomonas sp.]MAL45117.1 TetR family transcriptional regulator [Hyphomonas sp.]MAX83663.1 TetR family transcriptional regulator [Hyphomonas sp.]MBG67979.1 TetR family transcriptional regulator [Hyphomonas sp.]MBO6581619.1 TetR/AcrR family transcriptional regulator [Hyphomonas sp.]|tara:strand:+ start:19396 stop:20055 length:660 start_codon:yes stop_codon:yes gene_type:complete